MKKKGVAFIKMKSKRRWIIVVVLLLTAACIVGIVWYINSNFQSQDHSRQKEERQKTESPQTSQNQELSIWILGDSLAAHSRSSNSEGWGEGLQNYLKDETVVVRNVAMGGASSSSFIQSGSYKMVIEELQKGDYVIIQFGINDAWYKDRSTNPFTSSKIPGSFKNILKEDYIKPILKKGGHVILSTSVMQPAAMFYQQQEQEEVFYTPHVQAVRELVDECKKEKLDVLLLDTHAITQTLYHEMGMNEAYGFHVEDGIHYNNYGAFYVAGLIAEELKKLGLPCCQEIRTIEEVMAAQSFKQPEH